MGVPEATQGGGALPLHRPCALHFRRTRIFTGMHVHTYVWEASMNPGCDPPPRHRVSAGILFVVLGEASAHPLECHKVFTCFFSFMAFFMQIGISLHCNLDTTGDRYYHVFKDERNSTCPATSQRPTPWGMHRVRMVNSSRASTPSRTVSEQKGGGGGPCRPAAFANCFE